MEWNSHPQSPTNTRSWLHHARRWVMRLINPRRHVTATETTWTVGCCQMLIQWDGMQIFIGPCDFSIWLRAHVNTRRVNFLLFTLTIVTLQHSCQFLFLSWFPPIQAGGMMSPQSSAFSIFSVIFQTIDSFPPLTLHCVSNRVKKGWSFIYCCIKRRRLHTGKGKAFTLRCCCYKWPSAWHDFPYTRLYPIAGGRLSIWLSHERLEIGVFNGSV